MATTSFKQKGSAHVIIIVVLVIALLGLLGFVFWQNFIDKNNTPDQPQSKQTSQQNDTTEQSAYKTYETDTHPITFEYPESWSLENAQIDDQSDFSRSVDVKTAEDNVISFSVGSGGIGGTCGGVPPVRTTIDVVSTTLATPKTTTLSFTVTSNPDGGYDATYGLTDTYTTTGDKRACDSTFYYLFESGNSTYKLMGFTGTKHFANLDDARKFISSGEYAAIKKMILSLAY